MQPVEHQRCQWLGYSLRGHRTANKFTVDHWVCPSDPMPQCSVDCGEPRGSRGLQGDKSMTHRTRRAWLATAIAALSFATTALPAAAQANYPSRPITLIVPWGAGGGT